MLTNIAKAKKLGFWISQPETTHATGGIRLDIVLHEIPTKGMFCAKSVHLAVKTREHSIEPLKIHHPWYFERKYQVCAGLVEIIDDKGEKFEVLTLGGRLQIDTQTRFTAITLMSPAPILHITDARPNEKLFVDEIEILLAKRRAKRLAVPHSYEERLVNADPLILYISLINALNEKFEHNHYKENNQIMELLNFIHAESKRLQEETPQPLHVPTLEEIL